MKELSNFLKSSVRNSWLTIWKTQIYVRKQWIENWKTILCIATIQSLDWSKGHFTKLINQIEKLWLYLMIENILTERFYQFFIKRWYKYLRWDNVAWFTVIKQWKYL